MEQLIKIAEFVVSSFIHIWPYLVITIPIAVFVKLSGASNYISKALSKKPIVSIFFATVVGAFSPFCSCGVIPVIASLLIGGVPLAPVMSFWIASPSMDPEIFFLSTATIGWELSVWRLVSTFIISLYSGYITHLLINKGWLGENILRKNLSTTAKKPLKIAYAKAKVWLNAFFAKMKVQKKIQVQLMLNNSSKDNATLRYCIPVEKLNLQPKRKIKSQEKVTCNTEQCKSSTISFKKRLLDETWKATVMVAKFMTLAFFFNALIQFYVPQETISDHLGSGGFSTVIIASLIGIPFYTSNITALPLISGLLNMGMSEGAALAFLISGPMTTLPAMAAVWGLVNKKIFLLYISFALLGSILFGILVEFLRLKINIMGDWDFCLS